MVDSSAFCNMAMATFVFALTLPIQGGSAQTQDMILVMGAGHAGCGEFLRAADAERKRRPPSAAGNEIYDINYVNYSSWVDGSLTGGNYVDLVSKGVGASSASTGRMAWIENYCRSNPLHNFVTAAIKLRMHLIEHSQ